MSDLISRQAAMDALGERPMVWEECDGYYLGQRTQYDSDKLAIETLPSIEPKRGKWKPFDLTWGRSVWACDACGETADVPTLNGKPIFDYCPWCGAKMNDEEQKGEIK